MTPITLEEDREGGYKVTQGNLDSGCLAPDEALGIIAHALFGNGSPHRFLKPQAIPPPKLLPCPHCGNDDAFIINYCENSLFAQVICDASTKGGKKGCGSASGYRPSAEQAIQLWNKRAPTEAMHQITVTPCTPQSLEQLVAEQNPGTWIEWSGGECPVAAGTLLDVKFRDGEFTNKVPAGGFPAESNKRSAVDWGHVTGSGREIIAYRLHQAEPAGIDSEGGSHD